MLTWFRISFFCIVDMRRFFGYTVCAKWKLSEMLWEPVEKTFMFNTDG